MKEKFFVFVWKSEMPHVLGHCYEAKSLYESQQLAKAYKWPDYVVRIIEGREHYRDS